jgi:hypothetical protein
MTLSLRVVQKELCANHHPKYSNEPVPNILIITKRAKNLFVNCKEPLKNSKVFLSHYGST